MTMQEACVHHWVIAPPNGRDGWSLGVCKKCKAEREFTNIAETKYSAWAVQKYPVEPKVRS